MPTRPAPPARRREERVAQVYRPVALGTAAFYAGLCLFAAVCRRFESSGLYPGLLTMLASQLALMASPFVLGGWAFRRGLRRSTEEEGLDVASLALLLALVLCAALGTSTYFLLGYLIR